MTEDGFSGWKGSSDGSSELPKGSGLSFGMDVESVEVVVESGGYLVSSFSPLNGTALGIRT